MNWLPTGSQVLPPSFAKAAGRRAPLSAAAAGGAGGARDQRHGCPCATGSGALSEVSAAAAGALAAHTPGADPCRADPGRASVASLPALWSWLESERSGAGLGGPPADQHWARALASPAGSD